ncbi:hypothetical protein [Streptomyces longispororuber]|uniref:hypothetical protein n=1 Tax=Streptomyces longispororuber TaxID=68230 RepID=UPI00210DBED8|nr:hypothetical protein [Streptomyces longispororuber]MCQ4213257.1 hypothetical protein [Streptomyces longispororuber]
MGADDGWQTFTKDDPALPRAVRKEARSTGVRQRVHRVLTGVDVWVVTASGVYMGPGGQHPVRTCRVHLRPRGPVDDRPRVLVSPRTPLGGFLKGHGVDRGLGPGTGDARFDRAFRILSRHPERVLPLLTPQVRADTIEVTGTGWRLRDGMLVAEPPHAHDAYSLGDGLGTLVRMARALAAGPPGGPLP